MWLERGFKGGFIEAVPNYQTKHLLIQTSLVLEYKKGGASFSSSIFVIAETEVKFIAVFLSFKNKPEPPFFWSAVNKRLVVVVVVGVLGWRVYMEL